MKRNIKLCRPFLFLGVLLDHLGNQLFGHLHDYDALLPSRWPFPPPTSTWCAPWPPRRAPPTWCAPWPPHQAPPPSHPWCPPWAVRWKSQETCARKKEKNWGWQLSSWQMYGFWGWQMSEFGGGKCPNFGGGKCLPGKWPTPIITYALEEHDPGSPNIKRIVEPCCS